MPCLTQELNKLYPHKTFLKTVDRPYSGNFKLAPKHIRVCHILPAQTNASYKHMNRAESQIQSVLQVKDGGWKLSGKR